MGAQRAKTKACVGCRLCKVHICGVEVGGPDPGFHFPSGLSDGGGGDVWLGLGGMSNRVGGGRLLLKG